MRSRRVVVVGGGAAGIFAAIRCAELAPGVEVHVLERGPQFLSKVRISGGGRCNVTHACFDARDLASRFPRGGQALIGAFGRFQPRDTLQWFESRGVRLKTESDGRIFPVTDDSQTIIDCLLAAGRSAGVHLFTGQAVQSVTRRSATGFELTFKNRPTLECESLLLATGGCRTPAGGALAVSLGHMLEPPVPSLFTFHIETPWLRELSGISVESVEVAVVGTPLRERGSLLVTHWGLSGPAVLRLSAWGARKLHALEYRCQIRINWMPQFTGETVIKALVQCRKLHPSRQVVNVPLSPLPSRLWEKLVLVADISPETRWAALSRAQQHRLIQMLMQTELPVTGKSLNKEEFVTCGGVRLGEVDFKRMESRICPGLHFAGELLDLDGITGGFNFQAAWTTGWIAGEALATDSRISHALAPAASTGDS